MQLIRGSLYKLGKKQVKKDIVCFGAGMLPLYTEQLFKKLGIWNKIICFLDNNESKNGTYIGTTEKKIVLTVEDFRKRQSKNFILIITCETFEPIFKQLAAIEEWGNIECYAYPVLNYEYFKRVKREGIANRASAIQLPKVIHYCWFGEGKLGELQEKCISSWKEKCPEYEIIKWDENNYDIGKNAYMKEAYEAGKWAFVSDFARLDILYQFGGIYLDTDVELLKNMDELLQYEAFISYGEWPAVNSGAGIGCKKGDMILRQMRDYPRAGIPFKKANGEYNTTTNCIYESAVLREYGLKQDFNMQLVKNWLILPPDYFAPESILGEDIYLSDNTIGVHHCGGSWASNKRRRELLETKEKWGKLYE